MDVHMDDVGCEGRPCVGGRFRDILTPTASDFARIKLISSRFPVSEHREAASAAPADRTVRAPRRQPPDWHGLSGNVSARRERETANERLRTQALWLLTVARATPLMPASEGADGLLLPPLLPGSSSPNTSRASRYKQRAFDLTCVARSAV